MDGTTHQQPPPLCVLIQWVDFSHTAPNEPISPSLPPLSSIFPSIESVCV